MQAEEDQRNTDRHQREEGQREQIARKHICPETDGEREDAGEVRDDLDQEHQGREPPDRTEELLDVPATVLPDAVIVVVSEGGNRQSERHYDVRRGRFQTRDKTEQVRQKDEEEDRRQIAGEALMAVADNALALA